jgi:hypothetical protein
MTEQEVHTADSAASRLFDLRMVIAVLFVIYGVVLTILGFTSTSDADVERAGDINLNLWGGVAMLVVAALFGTWVWLRPLRLPTAEELEAAPDTRPPAH